jgi:hypothetical protein
MSLSPVGIICSVKFEHINEQIHPWFISANDTLSQLIGVFNRFFIADNDPTRRVKQIVHVTPYYSLSDDFSLADDTDNYRINYDCKTLETDIDVEDMVRFRTNGGDPLYLWVKSERVN